MTAEDILSFVDNYGVVVIAVLIFIEYLNIPGFPGGITAPVAGIVAKLGYDPFWFILLITSAASVLSVMAVYGACYAFSGKMKKIFTRSPKTEAVYEKTAGIIDKHGALGLFTARLIPVVRTFISVPSGLMNMKLREYIPVSAAGNTVYIFVSMLLGYFLTSLFM